MHVVLETIKQHLRILILKQYSTGNIFKTNAKTLEHPGPRSVVGGRALSQDWGERAGGVGGRGVPISDFIRLAGTQVLI